MIHIIFVGFVDRVALECAVTRDDILGRNRRPDATDARAIAVYCTRRRFRQSYPQLGELFHRSHVAVRWLDMKAQGLLSYDEQFAGIVERVMKREAA